MSFIPWYKKYKSIKVNLSEKSKIAYKKKNVYF